MKQLAASWIRPNRTVPLALFLLALLAAPSALACADESCEPTFTLDHDVYDGCNDAAFLNPGNDSRVNLQLLIMDARAAKGAPPPAPAPIDPAKDTALFTYDDFTAAYSPPLAAGAAPPPTDSDPSTSDLATGEGSRCVSNTAGMAAFLEAVRTAPGLSDAERAALIQARTSLAPTCLGGAEKTAAAVGDTVKSPAAQQFAAYLLGAAAFYDSDFDTAGKSFAGLAASRSPWLREAARYMAARVELNRAQVGAFGDYGELSRDKVDAASLAAADAGFQAYLRDYPNGAYAASARGLLRRVYWLGGQSGKLAGEFGWQFTQVNSTRTNVTIADLAQEVDNKLGSAGELAVDKAPITDPLLLATMDMVQMRHADPPEPGSPKAAAAFSLDELLAQKPAFAGQAALFDYLLAVHRLYVEKDPAGALKLLPASPEARAGSNLAYSERILRGAALEGVKDGSVRAYWLQQLAAARAPFQRPTVELALALNYERGDSLGLIFAPGSPIQEPDLREAVLRNDAAPPLLRERVRAADSSAHERRLALYVLLYKEITWGHDQAFLTDVPLIGRTEPAPADAAATLDDVKTFSWAGTEGKAGAFSCPSLSGVAGKLVQAPGDPHQRLCLGEFVRLNGLDEFELDKRPPPNELGGAPTQFPGGAFSRLEIYKQVIADPKAPADDRAYALYRAVNCYAPSGNNGCGGVDVPTGQRKIWFKTLKTSYAASPWATDLKYFW